MVESTFQGLTAQEAIIQKLSVGNTNKASDLSDKGIVLQDGNSDPTWRIFPDGGNLKLNVGSGGKRILIIQNTGSDNEGLIVGDDTMEATAIVEFVSTTRGFLPPRMTTTERDAISSPATGLMVYNTTTNKLNVYTGAGWEAVTSA